MRSCDSRRRQLRKQPAIAPPPAVGAALVFRWGLGSFVFQRRCGRSDVHPERAGTGDWTRGSGPLIMLSRVGTQPGSSSGQFRWIARQHTMNEAVESAGRLQERRGPGTSDPKACVRLIAFPSIFKWIVAGERRPVSLPNFSGVDPMQCKPSTWPCLTVLLALFAMAIGCQPSESTSNSGSGGSSAANGSSTGTDTEESAAMKVTESDYGKTSDGQAVSQYTCVNANGLTMQLITYGAIMTSFECPDKDGKRVNVTLSCPDMAGYEACGSVLWSDGRPVLQSHRQRQF